MNKIIIIDGNSLAFSRMPKKDEIENPIYRNKETDEDIYVVRKFIKKVLKYKYLYFNDYKVVVVFDEPNKYTFRHELYPKYKSKAISESRKEQKDYVYRQIESIKKMLNQMGIANYSSPNWEADDIIGMLKKKLNKKGWLTTIVTGDKDLIQLVDNKTRIAFLDQNRNPKVFDRKNIWEVSGEVWPDQIIGVKVLAGDKSDNIKGLGIVRDGKVDAWTQDEATNFIIKHKNLDTLIRNANKLEEPFRSSIIKGADKIKMRTKLITIVEDWSIDLDFNDFISVDMNPEGVAKVIENLNLIRFATMNKRVNKNLKDWGVTWPE